MSSRRSPLLLRFQMIPFVILVCASQTRNALAGNEDSHSIPFRIDSVVHSLMNKENVPGLSLVVLRHGQIVKMAGYGYENLEAGSRATPATVYDIGSVCKMFTAAAILRLVEQGKLHLTDPVSRFLEKTPAIWQPIQVRHLLNHTAGLIDYQALDVDSAKDYTLLDIIGKAAAEPLEYPVGEAYSYSNTDYILLGAIIEKITGQSYREAMEQLVFQPLGMTETWINDLSAVIPHRSGGYVHDGKALRNGLSGSNSMAALPDGGIITTVRDMAKWDQAMRKGTLLPMTAWNAMMSPTYLDTGRRVNYGYGWFIRTVQDHRVVEHGGNGGASNADVYRDLTTDTTIIVLANDRGGSAAQLVTRIVHDVLPETQPVRGKAPGPDEQTSERARRFVESWLTGKFDPDFVSPDFKLSMMTARNQSRLRRGKRMGKMQSWAYVESIADGEEIDHLFEMKTDQHPYRVTVTLLPNGKIGGLALDRED